MFRGFEGYVQADAASVYDALFRPSGPDDPEDDGRTRIEVACWSHARRKYWEAAFAGERVAREALLRIGKIFELDQTFRAKKGRSPYKIKQLRQEHLAPLVDELLEFAAGQYDKVNDQRSSLRGALGYTVRQADALRAFLGDGRLRLDNNRSENALRRVVRIRDASLFAGSDEHAEAAGHILTVIATARLHGLDPEAYLRDLIRVLPSWPRDRYLELAPMNWNATRARLDPEQLEREAGVIDVPEPSAGPPGRTGGGGRRQLSSGFAQAHEHSADRGRSGHDGVRAAVTHVGPHLPPRRGLPPTGPRALARSPPRGRAMGATIPSGSGACCHLGPTDLSR